MPAALTYGLTASVVGPFFDSSQYPRHALVMCKFSQRFLFLLSALSIVVSCAGKPPEKPKETGGTQNADAIEQAMQSHRNNFTACYEKEVKTKKKLSGKVGTKFVVGPDGKATSLSIESTTLKDSNTENCI